ncbi:hypothetical protein ACUZIT_004389 [Enterobacter hormaechei]
MSNDGKENFMVVGGTGSGKTTLCNEVLKKRFSVKQRADWLRLRNVILASRPASDVIKTPDNKKEDSRE